MKIHGGAWLVLGVFVWGYSAFIEKKAVEIGTSANMTAFKWLALAFMLWAAYRLTKDSWVKKKPKEMVGPPQRTTQPVAHRTHGSPHQTHQHIRNPHGSPQQTHVHTRPHPHQSHAVQYRRCPHCHHPMHPHAAQCPFCKNAL